MQIQRARQKSKRKNTALCNASETLSDPLRMALRRNSWNSRSRSSSCHSVAEDAKCPDPIVDMPDAPEAAAPAAVAGGAESSGAALQVLKGLCNYQLHQLTCRQVLFRVFLNWTNRLEEAAMFPVSVCQMLPAAE